RSSVWPMSPGTATASSPTAAASPRGRSAAANTGSTSSSGRPDTLHPALPAPTISIIDREREPMQLNHHQSPSREGGDDRHRAGPLGVAVIGARYWGPNLAPNASSHT